MSNWSKSNSQKNFDLHLGKIFKNIRKKLDYSIYDTIEKLYEFYNGYHLISEEYYGNIERGKQSLSGYKLILLISFFNDCIKKYNNNNNSKKIEEINFDLLELIFNESKLLEGDYI